MSPLALPLPSLLLILPFIRLLAVGAISWSQAGNRPLTQPGERQAVGASGTRRGRGIDWNRRRLASASGEPQVPGAHRRMALGKNGELQGPRPHQPQKGAPTGSLPKVLPAKYKYTTINTTGKPYFYGIDPWNTLLGYEQTTLYATAIRWPCTEGSATRFTISDETYLFGGNAVGTDVGYTYFYDNSTSAELSRSVFGTIKVQVHPNAAFSDLLTGVNILGTASGFYYDITSKLRRSFTLSSDGTYTLVTSPNTLNAHAWGINDHGDVVGNCYVIGVGSSSGFVLRGGFYFFSFGGLSTHPLGINNHGTIVGYYDDGNGDSHGLVIKNA